MSEQRHVYRVGKSLVVALPPQVREHLGVERGGTVYWHTVRGKEAVLTRRERRAGGHPEGLSLTRQLAGARAEVERLRRKLQARPLRVLHEGQSLGWGQAMEGGAMFGDVLAAISARLDSIEARMPFRRRRAPRVVEREAGPAQPVEGAAPAPAAPVVVGA